jgi:hypothetical protein
VQDRGAGAVAIQPVAGRVPRHLGVVPDAVMRPDRRERHDQVAVDFLAPRAVQRPMRPAP